MDVHSGNAADSLDKIRMGGQNLILTAQARLGEIKRALDHGRFTEAATVGNSLHEKLCHLAAAQSALGRLSDARLVRVSEIEPGMCVLDAGVVSEISPCSNCERDECDNVTLTFENQHKVALDCDDEVAISAEGE